MLDRRSVEDLIDHMRMLRMAGDTPGLVALFDDEATFRIVGFGEPAVGKKSIGEALQALVEEFKFLEWRAVTIVVEGDEVAIRSALTISHGPSGKVVKTETSDFMTFKDGKCLSYTQYIDTAMAVALSAARA